MLTLNSLGFVPFPLDDESPTSSIQRTIQVNGFRDYKSLSDAIKCDQYSATSTSPLYVNSSIAQALRHCAPALTSRIESNFYTAANPVLLRSDLVIHGVVIKWHFIRHNSTTAFCSECHSAGHERFPKDIKLFIHCPFHNRRYVECCPNCSKKLQWQSLLKGQCKCGHQIISPKAKKTTVVPDHYLLEVIKDKNNDRFNLIQDILTKLEKIIEIDGHEIVLARRDLAITLSLVNIKEITKAMRDVLPCSTAEEIDLSLSLVETYLSETTLTQLRTRLYELTEIPQHHIANLRLRKTEILRYVRIDERGWRDYEIIRFLDPSTTSGAYNCSDAIKIKRDVNTLRKEGFLLVTKAEAYAQDDTLSLDRVRSLTGLPKAAIRQLSTKSSLLSSDIKPRQARRWPVFKPKQINHYNNRYICTQMLAAQLQVPKRIIQQVITKLAIEISASKSVYSTMIIKKTDRALLERGITIFYKDRPAHRSRINSLLLTEKTDKLLDIEECSALLGTSSKTMRELVATNGPIPVHFKGKNGRYLILAEHVQSFKKLYITSQEASKLLGISLHKLYGHLDSLGVKRTCGELKMGNGGYYLLADVLRITISGKKPKSTTDCSSNSNKSFDHPIGELCDNSNFTRKDFTRIFLTSRLFKYSRTNSEIHITKSDAKTIGNILKTHITHRAADFILHAPRNYTRMLVKRGKLSNGSLHIAGLIPRNIVLHYKETRELQR